VFAVFVSAQKSNELSGLITKLNANAEDDALRTETIKLALSISPHPAVPEDAVRHVSRGVAAAKISKDTKDYSDAIAEFREAKTGKVFSMKPGDKLTLSKAGVVLISKPLVRKPVASPRRGNGR
jgi:hypothetical protein